MARDLRAKVRLEADTSQANRALRQSQTNFERFANFLTSRFTIGVGLATVALQKLFQAIDEGGRLEGQTEALRRNLAAQGQAFDDYIAKLDEVAQGQISTADLIQSSSQALLLGIPAEQIAELLEVARVSAIATGQEISQAFSDIATGIGRASPLILDNLGLVVRLEEVYGDAAEAVGKTSEQLTDQERKTALLNAVLDIGRERVATFGDAQSGAAIKTNQLNAALENLSNTIRVEVAQAFDEGTEAAQGFLGESIIGAVAEYVNALQEQNAASQAASEQAQALALTLQLLNETGETVTASSTDLAAVTAEVAEKLAFYRETGETLTETLKSRAIAEQELAQIQELRIDGNDRLIRGETDLFQISDKLLAQLVRFDQLDKNLIATNNDLIDAFGRRINAQGELIDKNGEVIESEIAYETALKRLGGVLEEDLVAQLEFYRQKLEETDERLRANLITPGDAQQAYRLFGDEIARLERQLGLTTVELDENTEATIRNEIATDLAKQGYTDLASEIQNRTIPTLQALRAENDLTNQSFAENAITGGRSEFAQISGGTFSIPAGTTVEANGRVAPQSGSAAFRRFSQVG